MPTLTPCSQSEIGGVRSSAEVSNYYQDSMLDWFISLKAATDFSFIYTKATYFSPLENAESQFPPSIAVPAKDEGWQVQKLSNIMAASNRLFELAAVDAGHLA